MERVTSFFSRIQSSRLVRSTTVFISKRPWTSFILSLIILFGIILLASLIGNPKPAAPSKQPPVKDVTIFHTGSTPLLSLQGTVEKTGVAKIVAQTAGIVQSVNVAAGDSVSQGTQLVNLSTNYQGGNASAVQRQLAQATYQNTLDSFGTQIAAINDQRTIATASAENTEQLRQISVKSLNDTTGLLNQNRDILNGINQQLQTLQATNTNGSNTQAIQQLQQAQLQAQATVNQLQNTYNTLSYQTNTANSPTTTAQAQEDATLKQLDTQEKSLELGKQTSALQLSLAQITESLMYPASPFAGTVDRVNVKPGDSVSPGTVLATISGNDQSSRIVVQVPQNLADQISRISPSTLHIGDTQLSLPPSFVSSDATEGTLYTISYAIPTDTQNQLTDGDSIMVDVPLTQPNQNSKTTDPYVPLDAVYQSEDSAYVYVVSHNKAESRSVALGSVYGKFVQVLSGITPSDSVILNRNVVDGEVVHVH